MENRVYAQSNRSAAWETYLVPDEGDSEELENEAKKEAMKKIAEDIIAKISSANNTKLNDAKLNNANLNNAQLNDAQLNCANLKGIKISNADFDFSCWPIWCGTLDLGKTDKKLCCQILYHALSVMRACDDKEVQKVFNLKSVKKLANQFHRVKECGEIE